MMSKAVILAALLFILPSSALAWTPITITRVVDGDTIAARAYGIGAEIRIRLYGIDCPEKKQPYGQRATETLKSMISGKRAEMDAKDTDRYGRTVALVRANGKGINEQMLTSGYAWVYTKYCKASFCDDWRALEESARSGRLGLWQDPKPMPPWEWRHR